MCQMQTHPHPAWYYAARRIAGVAATLFELGAELHAGRCWRDVFDEGDALYDLAVQDRRCIEGDPDVPAVVLAELQDTWATIRGAWDALDTLIQAAQRGHVRTEHGVLLGMLRLSDFTGDPDRAPVERQSTPAAERR